MAKISITLSDVASSVFHQHLGFLFHEEDVSAN